jgi:hypothetical protein
MDPSEFDDFADDPDAEDPPEVPFADDTRECDESGSLEEHKTHQQGRGF